MKKVLASTLAAAFVLAGCTTSRPMQDANSTETPTETSQSSGQVPVAMDMEEMRKQTIGQNLPSMQAATEFVSLIKLADLETTLEASGPYTVFIPTQQAFAAVPKATLEQLTSTSGKESLRALLSDHIVLGAYRVQDMKDGMKLRTVSGKDLSVSISGSTVAVAGVMLQPGEINHGNGFSHMVENVIMIK